MTKKNHKPIKDMTPAELREYKNEKERDRYARKKEEEAEAAKPAPLYPAAVKSRQKDDLDFLRDAGLQSLHVMETIVELAGIFKMSVQALKVEPSWSTELVEGEVIYRADLEGLRQFSCPDRSEKEFREFRYRDMTDHFFLGNESFQKPNTFCELPHRKWIDEVFIKKTPSLKPGYTQADIKQWFVEQTKDMPRRSLLMCSRQSQKSTSQILDAVQWVLCCGGDVRIMEVSAVKDLAKQFTQFFRTYWTIDDPHNRNLFAQLHPEAMVYAGSTGSGDANTFYSPHARLGLGPTMIATSMDANQTGRRFDVGIFDDVCNEENSAKPELRMALVEKYDSINKLCTEFGVTITIGTPQSADQSELTGELHAVILARSAKTDHRYLRYRIDPAWTLKPEFEGATVDEVFDNPDMIESLLFPGKLTLEFLREERYGPSGSEKGFRRQYLLEFTDALAEVEKLQFERSVLSAHILDAPVVPQDGDILATGDFAYSVNPRRDPSAFCVFRYSPSANAIFILEMVAKRIKESEKAPLILELTKRHGVKEWLFEGFPLQERLEADIYHLAQLQSTPMKIYWQEVKNVQFRKFMRLKSMELPLARGKIKFVRDLLGTPSAWIEQLFTHLEALNGKEKGWRSSSIKDDLGEVLSMAAAQFPLVDGSDTSAEEIARRKVREDEQARDDLYLRVFGTPRVRNGDPYPMVPINPGNYASQQSEDSPLHAALRSAGLVKEPDGEGGWKPSGAGFGFIRK